MGGKGGGSKQRVTEYYMSLHYGICQGIVEKLVSMKINDKLIAKCSGLIGPIISVNEPDLFGGVKKEGGVRGRIAFQDGSFTQLLDAHAASKLGGTPTTLPGYRGIATAFFTEEPGASQKGFYWSANQPYIPPTWFRVRRIDRTWLPNIAAIAGAVDVQGAAICLALDVSGSMLWGAVDNVNATPNRLDLAKSATTSLLESLRDSDYPDTLDIRIALWSDSTGTSYLQRRNCTAQDYTDLIAFVNAANALGATDYERAVVGLADFYSGSGGKCPYFMFLADGQAPLASAEAASATLLATGAEARAFNLFVTDTSISGLMDNTADDGVPVISSLTDDSLVNAFAFAVTSQIDMNPAHIIREALVDTIWGLGLPISLIDDVGFGAAAQTLYDERFGLSLMWVQQATVEDFVREVIDHIQATLFVHPRTGLWSIKLIRDDYDIETLPLFDETNSRASSFKRRTPAEITNEIVVTWTNPDNEEEEVVTMQDLGGIVANNGEILSDSRNYYAVRRRDLAGELAARDLSAASAPLASAELSVDRRGWDIVPGDVIKWTHAEYSVTEMLCRVLKVNYGKPGDSKVILSVSEDIFSYAKPRAQVSAGTLSTGLTTAPAVPSSIEFLSANFYMAKNLADYSPVYPDALVGFLIGSTVLDTQSVEVFGDEILATGATVVSSLGDRDVIAGTTLPVEFPAEEITSDITFADLTAGAGPSVGGFGLIGATGLAEDNHEIVLMVSEATGVWVVKRGMLDTTPQKWPLGTPIRFISADSKIDDPKVRVSLASVDYQFRTRTSAGLLPGAVSASYAPSERFYAPARPAAVTVGGVGFGYLDARDPGIVDFEVTWADRNRLTEETVLLNWSDIAVAAEAGQTTKITLIDDETNAVITSYTGLTGGTHTFLKSDFGTSEWVRVRVTSERDGFESIQGHEILVFTALVDPASLAEPSLWLDANVEEEIWQDVSKTIPVAANLDPVGFITNQRGTFL